MDVIGKTIVGRYIDGTIVKGTITDYRMRNDELVYYVNSVIIRQSNVLEILSNEQSFRCC